MINYLREIYFKEMFFPSWIGLFTNPFYFSRRNLALEVSKLSSYLSGNLLDVGCGTKPYQKLFRVNCYRGLDIYSLNNKERGIADDFYDGAIFPYSNALFDSVICNQVLEHVFNPDEFLSEICRVLKSEGMLILTAPFVWDEHEQPYDYARYSSFGLISLLEKNGFDIIQYKKLGADATAIFQLTNAYLFKVFKRTPKYINLLITVTVFASVNILGLLAGALLPKNSDLFLDHIVLAKKRS